MQMEHRVDTGDRRLKAFTRPQVAEYDLVNGWSRVPPCYCERAAAGNALRATPGGRRRDQGRPFHR